MSLLILNSERRKALRNAFESLFSHRTAQQIAMILELPDIRDTVCGKELIAEGKTEGALGHQQRTLLAFGAKKFGPLPSEVAAGIQKLNLAQGDELLFNRLFEMSSLDDLERWLSEHAA